MHRVIYLVFFSVVVVGIGSCSYYYRHQKIPEKTEEVVQEEPDFSVTRKAPDFKAIRDIKKRKVAFLAYLKPGIHHENLRIIRERQFLLNIQSKFVEHKAFSDADMKRLNEIAQDYKMDLPQNGPDSVWFQSVLRKVDILPEALVFIQAANESAWGTSRFARQGNNYFGQWCYREGCGLIPLARMQGATHEVAKFSSTQESIHRYFMNVNRNKAYTMLRGIRAQLREKGSDLTSTQSAFELTNGLIKYSERGEEYVNSLQAMIRHNQRILEENKPG